MSLTMKRRVLGFTLVELMVTIAVMAILLSIAAPNFSDMLKTNRVQSQMRDLYSQLNYARSEAVSRRKTVLLCHSSNASTCGGTWNNGWVVCIANSTNTDCDTTSSKNLLRVYNDLGKNTMSVVDDEGTPVAQDRIIFRQDGSLGSLFSPGTKFTLKICDSGASAKFARALLMVNTGQTLDSSQNATTGIYKDAKGGDLVCP